MNSYMLPIRNGTFGAPFSGVFWSFKASKFTRIRTISVVVGYDRNSSSESTVVYQLLRFTGDVTGGTSIVPVRSDNKMPVSEGVIRWNSDAALIATGATIEPSPIIVTLNQRSREATTTERHRWDRDEGIVIYPNEGICLNTVGGVLLGDCIAGYIEIEEYNDYK